VVVNTGGPGPCPRPGEHETEPQGAGCLKRVRARADTGAEVAGGRLPPLAQPTHERPIDSVDPVRGFAAGPLKPEVAVDDGLVMVLLDLLWWIRR